MGRFSNFLKSLFEENDFWDTTGYHETRDWENDTVTNPAYSSLSGNIYHDSTAGSCFESFDWGSSSHWDDDWSRSNNDW